MKYDFPRSYSYPRSNPNAPESGNASALPEPGLQKISDIAEQLPKAVILPGIDYRIQNRQINVKRIPARKPLVHLDIPDGTEKRCGVSATILATSHS